MASSTPASGAARDRAAPMPLQPVDVEINYWYPREKNIGHVSLSIPANYLYVSLWPDEGINAEFGKGSIAPVFSSVQSKALRYDQDVIAEGRRPDHVRFITLDLNMSAVEAKWKGIQEQNKYSLLRFNCVNAVEQVLRAGNPADFAKAKASWFYSEPEPNWTNVDKCSLVLSELNKFWWKAFLSWWTIKVWAVSGSIAVCGVAIVGSCWELRLQNSQILVV